LARATRSNLRGDVDTDDLAGERERSLAKTAPDVEEPFTLDKSQLFTFPCPQTERCRPLGGRVHRVDEHSDIRVVIHPLVAEPMCVVAFDLARLRRPRAGSRPTIIAGSDVLTIRVSSS
jgi:hypothetical protein